MAFVYTKTIGVGKDYTTFTLAEGDIVNIPTSPDLVAEDEAIVFEVDAGTYSESTVFFDAAVSGDADHQVTFKPAPGSEHNGEFGTGVIREFTGGGTYSFVTQMSDLVFSGLTFSLPDNTTYLRSLLIGEGSGVFIDSCLFDNKNNRNSSETVTNANWGVTFRNCVFKKLEKYSDVITFTAGATYEGNAKVINCSFLGEYIGERAFAVNFAGDLTLEVTNCIGAIDHAWYQTGTGTLSLTGGFNYFGHSQEIPEAIRGPLRRIFATPAITCEDFNAMIHNVSSMQLFDVSGQKITETSGAGPSVSSLSVPTTDLVGNPRSGATTLPGAWATLTSSLGEYNNPTEVIKSIGTNSRDYATIELAVADITNVAVAEFGGHSFAGYNGKLIFELYNDSVFQLASNITVFNSTRPFQCDQTRNITFRPAVGDQHTGIGGTGVRIINPNSQNSTGITAGENFMIFSGLSFDSNDNGFSFNALPSYLSLIHNFRYNVHLPIATQGVTFVNCFFNLPESIASTQSNLNALQLGSIGNLSDEYRKYAKVGTETYPIIIKNNVFHRCACGLNSPNYDTGPDVQAHYHLVNNTLINDGNISTQSPLRIGAGALGNTYALTAVNNFILVGESERPIGGYGPSAICTFVGSNNYASNPTNRPALPLPPFNGTYTWPTSLQGSPNPIQKTTLYDPSSVSGAGDYGIYVKSRGILLDSPQNSLVSGGVGPDVSSIVPTTDILGNPRTGSSVNPGAYANTSETVRVVRSLGHEKNYSTWNLGIADISDILLSDTETSAYGTDSLLEANCELVFEAFSSTPSQYGAYTRLDLPFYDTDKTRRLQLSATASQRHRGRFNTGVSFYVTSSPAIRCRGSNWTVDGIFINNGTPIGDGSVEPTAFAPGDKWFETYPYDSVASGGLFGIHLKNIFVSNPYQVYFNTDNRTGAKRATFVNLNNLGSRSNPIVVENCDFLGNSQAVDIVNSPTGSGKETHVRIVNCNFNSQWRGGPHGQTLRFIGRNNIYPCVTYADIVNCTHTTNTTNSVPRPDGYNEGNGTTQVLGGGGADIYYVMNSATEEELQITGGGNLGRYLSPSSTLLRSFGDYGIGEAIQPSNEFDGSSAVYRQLQENNWLRYSPSLYEPSAGQYLAAERAEELYDTGGGLLISNTMTLLSGTGRSLASPHNNAVGKGLSHEVCSIVPTTDMLGNPRDASSILVGPYSVGEETVEIVRTVGPGQQYSTMPLATGDIVNICTSAVELSAQPERLGTNLFMTNKRLVFALSGELGHLDSAVNTYKGTVVTDPTRNIVFSGVDNHNGYRDQGSVLAGSGFIVNNNIEHTLFKNIQFKDLRGTGGGYQLFTSNQFEEEGTIGTTLDGCLFVLSGTSNPRIISQGYRTKDCGTYRYPFTIKNCVLRTDPTQNVQGGVLYGSNAASGHFFHIELINNTFDIKSNAYAVGTTSFTNYDKALIRTINNYSFGHGNSNSPNSNTSNVYYPTTSGNWINGYLPDRTFGAGTTVYGESSNDRWSLSALEPSATDNPYYSVRTSNFVDYKNNLINETKGVGPASSTYMGVLVPSEDILGNPRTGTTTLPGAYSVPELNTISRRISKTDTGPDVYSTFTLAEADIVNIATSAVINDEVVNKDLIYHNAEIVFDVDAGEYVEDFRIDHSTDIPQKDYARRITYTAASDSGHQGYDNSGVRIVSVAGAVGNHVEIKDSYTTFDNFVIHNINESLTQTKVNFTVKSGPVGVIVKNNIIETFNNRQAVRLGQDFAGSEYEPIEVFNNVIRADRSNNQYAIYIYNNSSGDLYTRLLNNTVLGNVNIPAIGTAAATIGTSVAHEMSNNLVLSDRATAFNVIPTGENNFGPSVQAWPVAIQGSPYPITPTFSITDPSSSPSTDFAVYMGVTKALIDMSGNAVWQKGMGPASSTLVPTTDILGNPRSGLTANPGAFELDGNFPVIEVLRTIGPSRDYSTFSLAESDVVDIATSAIGGEDLRYYNGKIKFEADAGTYAESVSFNSSLTTDATRNVTYRPASGSEHGGSLSSGVIVSGSSGNTAGLYDDFIHFEGIVLKSSASYALAIGADGVTVDGLVLANTNSDVAIFQNGTALNPVRCLNCVAHATNGYGFYIFGTSTAAHVHLVNSTAIVSSGSYAIRNYGSAANLTLINHLGLVTSGAAYQAVASPTITGSNCFSTGTGPFPAAIQGSPYPVTTTTRLDPSSVSGADDYAIFLPRTGQLADAEQNVVLSGGVGPASSTLVPTTDIQGNPRSGATANPGAFEVALPLTETIRTIGASGQDYTTISLALGDMPDIALSAFGSTDIASKNARITFHIVPGSYARATNISNTVSGDSDRFITLSSTEPLGAVVNKGSIAFNAFTFAEPAEYFKFKGIYAAGTVGGFAVANTPFRGITVESCFLETESTPQYAGWRGQGAVAYAGTEDDPLVLINNIGATPNLVQLEHSGAACNVSAVNNTLVKNFEGNYTKGMFHTEQAVSNKFRLYNNINLNEGTADNQGFVRIQNGTIDVSGAGNVSKVNPTQGAEALGIGVDLPITRSLSPDTSSAIFVGTSGILFDNANNEAIGRGASSFAPTTDILGNTRVGNNPGAWGTTVSSVDTSTFSIGTSGRDFTTFTLANATIADMVGSSLVVDNTKVNFDVHNDDVFRESVNFGTNLEADEDRFITYQAASGDQHNGLIGTGSRLETSVGGHTLQDDYTIFDGLAFGLVGVQNSKSLFDLTQDTNTKEGTIFQNCIFYDETGNSNIGIDGRTKYNLGSQTDPIEIDNGVFYNFAFPVSYGYNGGDNFEHRFELINCSFLGNDRAIRVDLRSTNSTVYSKLVNLLAYNSTVADLEEISGAATHSTLGSRQNYGLRGDFPGLGSRNPVSGTTDLDPQTSGFHAIHVASGDPTPAIDSDNDILSQGIGPLVVSDVPQFDILGVERPQTQCEPGAFQVSGGGVIIPEKPTNPSPAYEATDVEANPTISWVDDPVTAPTGWKVYFSTSPIFTEADVVHRGPAGFKLEEALEESTNYFWKVVSTKDYGDATAVTNGPTWEFLTSNSFVPPSPDTPGKNESVSTDWSASSVFSRSRSWGTREGDVRAKIFKMTQAKSNISFVYRESLRSMIASFNDIGYFNSEDAFVDVQCVHGNAERTIAKLKQENNIILPIISVSQTVSDNDDDRRRYESVLIHEKYWDEEMNRAIRIVSLAPRPVNIKYQVNVWCKYMADMDQILEQIRLKFNPEMDIYTTYSTLAKASVDSEEAVGSMSAKDKEDRVIKKTLNVTLKTYIPSPKFLITSTGQIEEFKIKTD
jgi:hypothetical protein